ncbi:MAG: Smr/MutS family protein [Spirochaetes bacterium]|nr:Smr/MutS family protein [Spirochaetota bacterium]
MNKRFDIIDLHYVPPSLVKETVIEFLNTSYKNKMESVKIITGKGIGVYKKITIEVCRSLDFIDRVNEAPAWESGSGALYIYFKK